MLELKYIKPFLTAPMLECSWENDYRICQYEFGEKLLLKESNLRKNAPYIYAYLKNNQSKLEIGSDLTSAFKILTNSIEFCVWERMFGAIFSFALEITQS